MDTGADAGQNKPDPKAAVPALDELFERNLPALQAYLRVRAGGVIGRRESVADLAQSVCREVVKDLAQLKFDDEASFRAYLFLQATRKVLDRARYHGQEMRDRGREVPLPAEHSSGAPALVAKEGTPSRHAAASEELSRVEQAMQLLPENQREVLLLAKIAGVSYQEIAEQRGITESAVRGLVARGLATVASMLQQAPPGKPAAGD